MPLRISYSDAIQLQNTLLQCNLYVDDIDTGNRIRDNIFIFDVQDFSCVYDTEYTGMVELMFGPNKFQITDSYLEFIDGAFNPVADAKALADYVIGDISQYSA
jgi:hypothetical protein